MGKKRSGTRSCLHLWAGREFLVAMASGVQVKDDLILKYDETKIKNTNKYLIFKITDDKKFITIDCEGAPDATFDDFCAALPDDDCRYAVFDTPITTKSGAEANKMMFVSWSDDNAPIKKKMLYASSKLALKACLKGLVEDFQATCKGDLVLKDLQAKAGGV